MKIKKLKCGDWLRLVLPTSLLVLVVNLQAEEYLLGVRYTMPGQEAAIMLFVASQPEKPRGKDLVLLSESAGTGFGIYSFLFRYEEVVNQSRSKKIPVKRIMIGVSDEADAVKRIFNFPASDRDILILMDEWLETEEGGYQLKGYASVEEARRWVANSRMTVSIVNDTLSQLLEPEDIKGLSYFFLDSLHHSDGLDDREAVIAEYERKTARLRAGKPLDINTSHRSLYDGYLDMIMGFGEGLNYTSLYPGELAQAELGRAFGLGEKDIGLLLSHPPGSKDHLANLSQLSDAQRQAITGQAEPQKALPYLLNGDYYLSYMHTVYANLQFIQTIALASSKPRLTLVMKMPEEDFSDPIVIDALRRVNITRVEFWSEKSGERVFDLREDVEQPEGMTLRVANIFPASEKLLQALAYFSRPVVGTTGELSLFSALSLGKLPFQEWMVLQRHLNDDLARVARKAGQEAVASYFENYTPGKKAAALRKVLQNTASIGEFTDELRRNYNASPMLRRLITMTFNDKSLMWRVIRQIDVATMRESLHTLPVKWQDIAFGRKVIKAIAGLNYKETSEEDLDGLKTELSAVISKIKTPLFRQLLQSGVDGLYVPVLEDEEGFADDDQGEFDFPDDDENKLDSD